LKINLGVINVIKDRIPKKVMMVIMPVISLLITILIVSILVSLVKSCVQQKHSNVIDLDLLEPDGTINERKLFNDSTSEDIEQSMRYRSKKDEF